MQSIVNFPVNASGFSPQMPISDFVGLLKDAPFALLQNDEYVDYESYLVDSGENGPFVRARLSICYEGDTPTAYLSITAGNTVDGVDDDTDPTETIISAKDAMKMLPVE